MKYLKKPSSLRSKSLVFVFIIFMISIGYFQKEIIQRSLVTINIGSLYVKLLNEKAEIVNFLKKNQIETLSFSMSPNNYVRLQKERAKMVNNFIFNNSQWSGKNSYYKTLITAVDKEIKAEIRLFGLNPDHFRDVNGHSFRVKYDGGEGYGKKQVNFLNPRSRDFITDPLINIIYSKLYKGIGIKYKPYRIILNKSNYGIFYKEDFFDKYLIEENNMRESLIFEVVNDSIQFNYKGENNSLDFEAFEIDQLFTSDYNSFINKIDTTKLKAVMKLGLLINDEHPFSDINMHWYYNPVNNSFEPTIREGFTKKMDSINLNGIANNNLIIRHFYNNAFRNQILNELKNEIIDIEEIINNDKEYNDLKRKMIGFSNEITKRENLIKENINFIKNYSLDTINFEKKKSETTVIRKDTILKNDFIVNPNQNLIIKPGVTIFLDKAYMKIFGSFNANGTKENPIKIHGRGELGTIFFNSNKEIIINNVNFKNLTNRHSKFNQPASMTFYESDFITISNSIFSNNSSGDDYLNFFRSNNVSIKNSQFLNILNDAIDSDFSSLTIKNSKFSNIGNDAVDGSGSFVNIDNSSFTRVKDKAISAGEKSNFRVTNSSFTNNEIGIVSKDASYLYVSNLKLLGNRIDFTSFIKKPYFGPSETYFDNVEINNYLIERNSIINGKDSIIFSTNVESKLYGNIYGKSSE
tara:strand:+ start:597 stop:2675 length:2079 start_codon:yes stop_codon:yes gene_type:complete